MKDRFIMSCGMAALLLVTGQFAHAAAVVEVVNVNCGHNRKNLPNGDGSMDGRANAADRGVAPAAYPGSTWTDGMGGAGARLKNSENNATGVGFRITDGAYAADDWVANVQSMLKGGWVTQKSIVLEIDGLDKANIYYLYLASQDSYGRNNGGSFTTANVSDAGTKTLVSTGRNLNGATWVEGEDYVVFKNIVPTAAGTISITFSGALNGFQLVRKEPRQATTTTLARTIGAASSNFGDPVTFTATVAGIKPTGKVAFFDGDAPLGTAELDGSFKASIAAHELAGGEHRLTARYSGDAKNAPSISAPLAQSVSDKRPATTTTLAVAGGAKSLTYGDSVTLTATVAGAKPTGKVIFCGL